ncbi:hypothetical protein V8B55DRAFT_1354329 [Mucor lusitanicus]|uniref:Secreted protein n=1 Tax=Mucor circinelloides f. lusitanicus TaxID=29924 RepID=A0A8H4F5V9_MUCCL|nr:hypothetical protein FB192DRAFT_1365231 [Mucor lusitanicus]
MRQLPCIQCVLSILMANACVSNYSRVLPQDISCSTEHGAWQTNLQRSICYKGCPFLETTMLDINIRFVGFLCK